MRNRGIEALRGHSYGSLERVAARVRSSLLPADSDLEPIAGLELFEHLNEYRIKVRGRTLALDYGVCRLATGVEARTCYYEDDDSIAVELNLETYDGLRSDRPRSLFTLAHEVGHAVLHPEELIAQPLHAQHAGGFNRGAVRRHEAFRDTEWQANGFAAALLMPAQGLLKLERRGDLTADRLVRTFAVSHEAADLRIKVFRQRRSQLLAE